MAQQGDYYWIELTGPASEAELASWKLFEAGVPAIEEPEGAAPGEAILRVSHSDLALINRVAELLPNWHQKRGNAPNRDWDLWWRSQQEPIQVTPALRVLPPWVVREPLQGVLDLTIEAKMAFGVGHHETTKLAALLMENQLAPLLQRSLPPRLLDIGTGTGILAMYASYLGAETIGTEIDPVTVECLAENWKSNGLGEARAILGPLSALSVHTPYEMIVCNMIRSEVWPLRQEILERLAPGGFLVLSGQLAAEKRVVLEWFLKENLEVVEEMELGEWWAVSAQYTPYNCLP